MTFEEWYVKSVNGDTILSIELQKLLRDCWSYGYMKGIKDMLDSPKANVDSKDKEKS